jgi:luciferase family oxidoreductase group 1
MGGIASSAPEILIEHAAALTHTIRIGSGGIMLPNHAPLRIAESFQTLEALHPNRIDLGIGRAAGTDPVTSSALRPSDADEFPERLMELIALSNGTFPDVHPFHNVRVVPGGAPLPPIWLLGSSGASARLAGVAGVGYSFARHFSTTAPAPAIRAYRDSFRPTAQFPRPNVVLAISVVCAETHKRADDLASSMDLSWIRLHRGEYGESLPSVAEARAHIYSAEQQAIVERFRALHFIGTPSAVRAGIELIVEETHADEIMVTTMVHDHAARLRSYELLADALGYGH